MVAMPVFGRRELPLDQPAVEATADDIASGAKLYVENCVGCHGQDAVGRFGGSVPDLRFAVRETHLQWQGIVVGGARRANGMPAQELSLEDSEKIRQYVLSLSAQVKAGKSH